MNRTHSGSIRRGPAWHTRLAWIGPSLVLLSAAPLSAGQWITFVDETAARMPTGAGLNDPAVTTGDPDDKNYAWGDVDQDGDIDVACVRKVAYAAGRRRNVLYMNEGIAEGHAIDGVLVDRTALYASAANDGGSGFLDLTDDRDVVLLDVTGDGWLDMITATTYGAGLPKTVSHPRVYVNLGAVDGVWQGFLYDEPRSPLLPIAPNFCGIGQGDVTGDGAPDLYFIDYVNTLEDRLWINNGTGTFIDESTARLSFEMRESEFGVHAVIADLNGDGANDVVKDRANGFPYRISISYNDPANVGFFNDFEAVYNGSPYYVEVADLNNDGRLDIVLQDDGIDRYLLNQGNGADGRADFINFAFPPASNGIEGTIELGDLDRDGFIDVLVTDESVNNVGTPCSRRMRIWRNLANPPDIAFVEDTAGLPIAARSAVSDVAVADLNGDDWPDLVIGSCSGTRVFINQGLALCTSDADCDLDGLFCTVETCADGSCVAGPDPCPGLVCDEAADACTACLVDADCSVGAFCSTAVCTAGQCLPGADPCPGQLCDETLDQCVDCLGDADCNADGLFCSNDVCTAGQCSVGPTPCPGLACDEASDSCIACLTDNACDDGDPCNGAEACAAGVCVSADGSGVVNGTFDGPMAWGSHIDTTGEVTFLGALKVTGADGAVEIGSMVWAQQDAVVLNGAPLEFDLLSYTSSDLVNIATNRYDRPVFMADGIFYGLNHDGTLGTAVDFVNTDYGTIANNNQSSVPIHFTVDVAALTGSAGPVAIGFGVMSVDSMFGAGIALFDNVTPALTGVPDPCPGQLCDPGLGCVDCLTDGDCDADGLFCTGDVCLAGACAVADPCPGGACDEAIGGCVDDGCLTDADCEDGLACTRDVCRSGVCLLDGDPCPGLRCDEIRGCIVCAADADCSPGEACCDHQCRPAPCPLQLQPKAGDALTGLSAEQFQRFTAGRAAFDRNLTAGEGLGPIFNRESCGSCHSNPLGGSGTTTVTRFGVIGPSGAFDPLEELGGSLLQAQAIVPACQEVVPVIPGETVHTAIRSTPSTLGAGLLEAIADSAIEQRVLLPPAPEVNGRVHMVQPLEGGAPRVGRFGWKAQIATVLSFSGDAALNEMGMTNALAPVENAPNGDLALLAACDPIADPEDQPDALGARFIDRVTDFQRYLAPPPQTPRSGMTGESLFAAIGCATCHLPVLYTPDDADLEPALRAQVLHPYSDFLLHDVGPLADGVVQGDARGSEIRTPPLWGLRMRDPLLHDASAVAGTFASRVHQAVVAHGLPGSEAEPAVSRYLALSPADRAAVIAFLDSLGRCEFDHTGDNQVDPDDYVEFLACFSGPGTFYTPNDACSISDFDQDGDVDEDDRAAFRQATTSCCDLDGDGQREDGCLWCDPEAGTCLELTAFGDVGGSFGACLPDGFANVHDRNQVLTCFSSTTTCPQVNADIGGAFGACPPDGFCNIHDANLALAAFAGTTVCSCPSAPTPETPAVVVGQVDLRIAAERTTTRTTDALRVRVFIDGPVRDLRSYQLDLQAIADDGTVLEPTEIVIEPRTDHVFVDAPGSFAAFDVAGGRIFSGLEADHGVTRRGGAYLATFVYPLGDPPSGTVHFDLDRGPDSQTVFVAPHNGAIRVRTVVPARVRFTGKATRSGRRGE